MQELSLRRVVKRAGRWDSALIARAERPGNRDVRLAQQLIEPVEPSEQLVALEVRINGIDLFRVCRWHVPQQRKRTLDPVQQPALPRRITRRDGRIKLAHGTGTVIDASTKSYETTTDATTFKRDFAARYYRYGATPRGGLIQSVLVYTLDYY
ncbi:MAG TPA: hypothetical protein VIT90_03070 [Lysobacter sp.]